MRNIKINLRLTIVLCLSGLLLGIAVFLVYGYQKRRQSENYLPRARQYAEKAEEETNPPERLNLVVNALKSYQNYLNEHEEDIEVLREEATFCFDQGIWLVDNGVANEVIAKGRDLVGKSQIIFEKILRAEKDRKDIRRQFVKMLFKTNQHATALDHLKFLCNFPKDEKELKAKLESSDLLERGISKHFITRTVNNDLIFSKFYKNGKTLDTQQLFTFLKDDFWILLEDPELLNIFGRCQIATNNIESAIEALDKSVTKYPHSIDAYNAFVKILRLENASDRADFWAAEVVKQNPDMFRAYLIRSQDRLLVARVTPKEKVLDVLSNAERDALQATQKAIQQLVESADKIMPRNKITEKLQQSFNKVENVAPKIDEKITLSYQDALLEAVANVPPVSKLMKEKLAEKEKNDEKDTSAVNASSLKTSVEEALKGCQESLLLAVNCERQKAELDQSHTETHLHNARELAKAILKIFPEDEDVYITLAYIELQAKNIKEVTKWMLEGAEYVKDNTAILWQLGVIYAATDQTKEARDILKQLKERNAPLPKIKYIEAMLDVHDGNWSDAETKLKKIRPEFILDPERLRGIDVLLATCYGHLGRPEDQREALVHANASEQGWNPNTLIQLARSRVETGQFEEALKDYETLLAQPNVEPYTYIEYADLLLKMEKRKSPLQRNYVAVADAIQQANKAVPDSFATKLLETDLLIAKGEIDLARDLLEQLHKNINEAKQKTLAERKKLQDEANAFPEKRDSKLAEAKKVLEKVKVLDAQQTHLWTSIVAIDLKQKNWKAAEEAIQKAKAKLGDTPEIRWLQVQKIIRKSGKEGAKDLHPLAENLDKFDEDTKLNLLRGLAVLAIRFGDVTQAEKLTKYILKKEPADIEMQKVLFEVATNKRDLAMMQTTLDAIRKLEAKESAFWCYGEGFRTYTLSQKEKDPKQKEKLIEKALFWLDKAQQLEPDWFAPALFSAKIYLSQGKIQKATDFYDRAVRNGVQDPKIIQRLATLLTQQGRYQEADDVFNRLSQTQQNNLQNIGFQASYVKARLGDLEKSVNMARETCKTSKKHRDFIWFGRILGVSAKQAKEDNRNEDFLKLYQEAEQAFQKAIELKNTSVEPYLTFVHFYSLFGHDEKAMEVLKKAKSAISPEMVNLMMAQAYETLGKIDEAATYYRKAIYHAPDNFNIAKNAAFFFMKHDFNNENEKLLNRIISKDVKATDEQVAWAKRMLSFVMTQQKGAANIAQTIKLIDENLKNNPNSILDLRTKASLLANDPTGSGYDDAIRLLEKVKSFQYDPGIAVESQLADLYYLTGQWNESKKTMENILGKVIDHPRFLTKYVIRLAEHGEYDEAQARLEQLKNVAPDSWNTVLAEYSLLEKQKRYDEILEMLKRQAERESKTLDSKKRLFLTSQLTQKCALHLRDEQRIGTAKTFEKQAEDFLLKYIQLEPKAKDSLIVLYAKQNNFDKVLLILRQAANKDNPFPFGMSAYACLHEGDFSKEQLRKIQQIVQRVSNAHPDNSFLKTLLAFYEEGLGNSREAEAILRKVLEEHPDDVNALNCLAVTLALEEKDLPEARKLIEKAIKIDGPKPDLLDSRAMISLAQKRPEEAINDLREAISKKPSASFYFHLADALYKKGSRKFAKDALNKAKKLGLREANLSPKERRNYRRLNVTLD